MYLFILSLLRYVWCLFSIWFILYIIRISLSDAWAQARAWVCECECVFVYLRARVVEIVCVFVCMYECVCASLCACVIVFFLYDRKHVHIWGEVCMKFRCDVFVLCVCMCTCVWFYVCEKCVCGMRLVLSYNALITRSIRGLESLGEKKMSISRPLEMCFCFF